MNTDYQYTGQRTVGEIGLHFYREASLWDNARWHDSYLNRFRQAPRLAGDDILTDRLFTGQRDVPSIDLMDYNARMYSPFLGRFIQPDTIVPNLYNPQSLNRYSYVLNNPIRYTDPTGHCYAVGGNSVWIPDGNDGPCSWLNTDTQNNNSNSSNGGGNSNSGSSGGKGPIPLPVSDPTPCPQALKVCVPTATITPSPTSTLWKPIGQQAGENVANTAVAAVSTYGPPVIDYCFGPGDLSGVPGCAEIVDMAAQAAPAFGIPVPQAQYGQVFDALISSFHVAQDNIPPTTVQITPTNITVTIITILIVIPIIPPFP